MASNFSERNNTTVGQCETATMYQDLMDDVTEPAGKNRNRIGGIEEEINVKWQLKGTSDMVTAKKKIHQLLATLLIAFPEQVTLIDKNQREWIYQEAHDADSFEKELEKANFQLHPIKNKQKHIVRWITILKFRTIPDIKEWKNNDYFFSMMTETGTYLFPHPFGVDDWDPQGNSRGPLPQGRAADSNPTIDQSW